jgi:hypothetical protein
VSVCAQSRDFKFTACADVGNSGVRGEHHVCHHDDTAA